MKRSVCSVVGEELAEATIRARRRVRTIRVCSSWTHGAVILAVVLKAVGVVVLEILSLTAACTELLTGLGRIVAS